jgi:hypothetical protein
VRVIEEEGHTISMPGHEGYAGDISNKGIGIGNTIIRLKTVFSKIALIYQSDAVLVNLVSGGEGVKLKTQRLTQELVIVHYLVWFITNTEGEI